MSNASESYADRVLEEALRAATGGLDPERVAGVVGNIVEALDKAAAAMKAAEYKPEDYEKIARAAAHITKSADGLVRLVEFAQGRPDSRPDVGGDWLKALTNEQLAIVKGWIEGATGSNNPPARGQEIR